MTTPVIKCFIVQTEEGTRTLKKQKIQGVREKLTESTFANIRGLFRYQMTIVHIRLIPVTNILSNVNIFLV